MYILGLKPGGQYEVQVLGVTHNGLPNIDFSWHFVELPAIDPILPTPVLKYTVGQSVIKVYIFTFNCLACNIPCMLSMCH